MSPYTYAESIHMRFYLFPTRRYYRILFKRRGKYMNGWLWLSCMVAILTIFNDTKAIVVISLGSACSVAGAMREYGIRTQAYPFDWIVSPFEGLYQAFDDDFVHLLQEDSLTIRSYDRYGIVDYYGFEYVHDFPTQKPNDTLIKPIEEGHIIGGVIDDNWGDFLPQIKEKYQRRLERLYTVFNGEEEVYLIRYGIKDKSEMLLLRDLLHKKYPRLNFMLIALGNSPEMSIPWQADNIKNFYINDKDLQQWKELFIQLKLLHE